MVYFQLQAPQPEDMGDVPKNYESYSCTVRYNDASLSDVTNSNVWFYGYKGTSLLTYAQGTHDVLNLDQHVDNHPYVINYNNEKTLVKTDTSKREFFEQCTFTRDFKTIWSDIPLMKNTEYKYIVGYKVYKSTGFATPTANGFNDSLTFELRMDGASFLQVLGSVTLMLSLIL